MPRPLVLLLVGLLGCGDATATTGAGGQGLGGAGGNEPDDGCAPGEIDVEGDCQPAGLPPDWAPPAVAPDAGVETCGEGFVEDGEAGCEPILPPTPCTGLTMAAVGDGACVPLADCGSTTWGTIPTDASTIHVDGSYAGVPDGSASAPHPTIQAAVDAAPVGATIAVAAGTYAEDVVIADEAVTLWGRCPELVHVEGTAAAVWVEQAPGTVVRGLTATAPDIGIAVVFSPGSVVQEVASVAPEAVGIGVLGDGEEVVVRRSLVADAGGVGMLSQGSMAIEECEVRGGGGPAGFGIATYPASVPASLRVEATYVHDVSGVGVLAQSASVEVSRSVVNDVAEDAGPLAPGIELSRSDPSVAATATVSQSVIRRSRGAGIAVLSSTATIEDCTIADVDADARGLGAGIAVIPELASGAPAEADVRRSTIRDASGYGVEIGESVVALDRVLVDGVRETAAVGRGVGAFRRSDVTITDSEIVPDASAGVIAIASAVAIEGSVIRRVRHGGQVGVGVVAQRDVDGDDPTEVMVVDSRIEDIVGDGALAFGAPLTLDGVTITDVRAADLFGVDTGGGVVVTEAGAATLLGSDIREVVTGVVSLDSTLDLERTRIQPSAPGSVGSPYADGRGLELQHSAATIARCEIGPAFDAGVAAFGSSVEAEALAVHDVVSLGGLAVFGVGIGVFADVAPASLITRGTLIERVDGIGLLVDASPVVAEDTLIRDIRPGSDGSVGRGATLQNGTAFELTDSRIETTHELGLAAIRSHGDLLRTVIVGVAASADDGLFGDGVAIIDDGPVVVEGCTIHQSARAGLSVFGSQVTVKDTDLRCNDLALAVDALSGSAPELTDGGGNLCGCDDALVTCKALSAGLSPPGAVDTGGVSGP